MDRQGVAHTSHNLVSDQFKTDTLIPSLHALAFVASQLNTFVALMVLVPALAMALALAVEALLQLPLLLGLACAPHTCALPDGVARMHAGVCGGGSEPPCWSPRHARTPPCCPTCETPPF